MLIENGPTRVLDLVNATTTSPARAMPAPSWLVIFRG
jgi:hypothetical protein